jgi:thiamine-phosphate pyrophosphorylase
MLPEMTPAVARAVEAAWRCARARGAAAVEALDLLHGLLLEEEGRAAVLLIHAGGDLAHIRRQFPVAEAPAHPHDMPLAFDAISQDVMLRATELAAELTAQHTVASEALLLALLHTDQTTRRLVESAGANVAGIETEIFAGRGAPLELEEPLFLDDATERVDAARILDASANRAREALRVIEDYCRFVLDDAFLSGETKRLRHTLVDALAALPSRLLLEARETERDVGTRIATVSEEHRHSLGDVVQVNLKRLQEALRSLEEYAKLSDVRAGRSLEQLRYRAYTLERAIILGAFARERLAEVRLCVLLTGSLCRASMDWTIQEAAAGGTRMFQLREKQLDDRALLERAHRVRRWTRKAGALFIMNDRPDIARLADADGVHLGQDDLSVKDARRVIGPDALIGVSTHNLEQVQQAIRDGASYVGVGPTFPSGTKQFAEFAGLDFVRQAMAETSLPAFVIGGVNADTIGQAIAAGARRVAVSQAVCQADDPHAVAAALVQAIG